jgi:hypothetical protein
MIRDNHDFRRIPNLRVLSKLTLEHPDAPWPADVVSQQNVSLDPNIIGGLNPGSPACPRQDFLG